MVSLFLLRDGKGAACAGNKVFAERSALRNVGLAEGIVFFLY